MVAGPPTGEIVVRSLRLRTLIFGTLSDSRPGRGGEAIIFVFVDEILVR